MAADPNDLTTVASVQAFLLAGGMAATDDAVIQMAITWASRIFVTETGQTLGAGTAGNVFNSQLSFTEVYDGNGSDTLYLRNRPVASVQSLAIENLTIPLSTGWGSAGYFIDTAGSSLGLRNGTWPGTTSPTGSPLAGSFYFWRGRGNIFITYTAGYASTPTDIQQAVVQMASILYKRRNWLDEKSRSMAGGGGTTSYQAWPWPPEVGRVMLNYKRMAVM